MPKTANLLTLVGALVRDAEVRRRFNEKPRRVMTEYRLTKDDREVLWSMDPAKVVASVDGLVGALKQLIADAPADMDPDEFPPVDEDYMETGTGPLYPDPAPNVTRLRPRKIKVPADAEAFEFDLLGQSFSRGPEATAEVELIPAIGPNVLMATVASVFGTFRCSRMHVVVRPMGGGTVAEGRYKVTFVNCPGANALKKPAGEVKVEHV